MAVSAISLTGCELSYSSDPMNRTAKQLTVILPVMDPVIRTAIDTHVARTPDELLSLIVELRWRCQDTAGEEFPPDELQTELNGKGFRIDGVQAGALAHAYKLSCDYSPDFG